MHNIVTERNKLFVRVTGNIRLICFVNIIMIMNMIKINIIEVTKNVSIIIEGSYGILVGTSPLGSSVGPISRLRRRNLHPTSVERPCPKTMARKLSSWPTKDSPHIHSWVRSL